MRMAARSMTTKQLSTSWQQGLAITGQKNSKTQTQSLSTPSVDGLGFFHPCLLLRITIETQRKGRSLSFIIYGAEEDALRSLSRRLAGPKYSDSNEEGSKLELEKVSGII